ncbi:hypothetical protein ACC703_38620, partial [Rhizobium ruizarguesonis]
GDDDIAENGDGDGNDLWDREAEDFAAAGGRTVVEPTCKGIGRDPLELQRISKASGINIVMGAGYYLGSSHPEGVAEMSVDEIAGEIVREA